MKVSVEPSGFVKASIMLTFDCADESCPEKVMDSPGFIWDLSDCNVIEAGSVVYSPRQ